MDRALRLDEARAGRVGRGVAIEQPARVRTPPDAGATRERAVDRRRGSAPAALVHRRISEMRRASHALVDGGADELIAPRIRDGRPHRERRLGADLGDDLLVQAAQRVVELPRQALRGLVAETLERDAHLLLAAAHRLHQLPVTLSVLDAP